MTWAHSVSLESLRLARFTVTRWPVPFVRSQVIAIDDRPDWRPVIFDDVPRLVREAA